VAIAGVNDPGYNQSQITDHGNRRPRDEALASDGRAVSAWLESLVVASPSASLYLWLSQ